VEHMDQGAEISCRCIQLVGYACLCTHPTNVVLFVISLSSNRLQVDTSQAECRDRATICQGRIFDQ
jgi:hypothetical protein